MKTGYFLKHLAGTCLFYSVLFVSAGRTDFWQAWVYVFLGIVMLFLNYTVFKPDAALLKERSKPGPEALNWDKTILGLSFLATITMFVIAGLDTGRYHWSAPEHAGLHLAGLLLTAAGQLLFLIAQKQNGFFSSTVRIQSEREHVVCDTGLYKFVRHPAYLGSMIQALGFPLLFGSVWSSIPVVFMVLLFLIRTKLEDAFLKKELSGYSEYAEKTRFKILPHLW